MARGSNQLWEELRPLLPEDQWVTLAAIVEQVRAHGDLAPPAELAAAIQKSLAAQSAARQVIWAGDHRWMLLSAVKRQLAEAEEAWRRSQWAELLARGAWNRVLPATLKELGIYRGQAGIYAHRTRTALFTDGSVGVTVSVLHTGSAYTDDFDDAGVVYHYPKTGRVGASDANEIEATKWAARLRLPVFVVSYPSPMASIREVRLGWVTGWDDEAAIFQISFQEEAPASLATDPPLSSDDLSEFELESDSAHVVRLAKARPGQSKFKFEVLARYGAICAVCDQAVREVIDAAHILGKGQRGSDDPRNGLPLCATHHRAFDANLFTIHPETLEIHVRTARATRDALQITRQSIAHLPRKPHELALRARWLRAHPKETG